MKAPTRKRPARPLEADYCRGIVLAVKRVLGVDITIPAIGELPPADQRELHRLASKIFSEKVPTWHADALKSQREQATAEAQAFAARVEAAPPPDGIGSADRELLAGNQTLLAQYARETGRKPDREQARSILDNRNPAATLADVSVPTRPEPTSSPSAFETFASTSELRAAEVAELERLVELAAGESGLFQKRRDDARRQKDMSAALDRLLALAPRRRRHFDEPGAVTLPPLVFEDVLTGALWLPDVAVLTLCLSALEARKAWGDNRVEDGGETLVLTGHFHGGVESIDPRGQLRIEESFDHLQRSGWLSIEKAQVETGRELLIGGKQVVKGLRIRLGPRMLKALEKRADVS